MLVIPARNETRKEETAMMTATEKVLLVAKRYQRMKKTAYPNFGLGVLSWRVIDGKNVYPTFALFELDSPIFEMGVDGYDIDSKRWTFKRMTPFLPGKMMDCYDDLFKNWEEMSERENKSLKLMAKLNGCLPPATKEKIEQARKEFEHIYIMVEVNSWKLNEEAVLPKDPLIVGLGNNCLSIIDQFDLTEAEEQATLTS